VAVLIKPVVQIFQDNYIDRACPSPASQRSVVLLSVFRAMVDFLPSQLSSLAEKRANSEKKKLEWPKFELFSA
jgi:hypothetical protein